LAAIVAFALLLPILWGAVQVRNEQGLVRSLEAVELYSLRLSNYLVSTGTFHYNLWSWRFRTGPGGNFFPGLVSLGLAAFWLARRSAWRDRRTHLLLAVGIVAFVLALGTNTPVYKVLYHYLPPLQSIRAVNRFGYVVLLAIAGLAALGLAALRARGAGRSWAVPALLIFVANAEAFMAPYPYVEFEGFSPVYRRLAADSEAVGVVAEFPFPPARGSRPSSYELASTEHWRPLLSGYSGFRPASFREAQRELQNFPDSRSLELLHRRQVTHVVVHFGLYRLARAESIQRELDQLPQFRLLAEDEDQTKLYRFLPDGRHPSAVAADGEPPPGGP
jgi:hypothetical protein